MLCCKARVLPNQNKNVYVHAHMRIGSGHVFTVVASVTHKPREAPT